MEIAGKDHNIAHNPYTESSETKDVVTPRTSQSTEPPRVARRKSSLKSTLVRESSLQSATTAPINVIKRLSIGGVTHSVTPDPIVTKLFEENVTTLGSQTSGYEAGSEDEAFGVGNSSIVRRKSVKVNHFDVYFIIGLKLSARLWMLLNT